MNERQKLIAWIILGLSLALWFFLREKDPMVTPVLLAVTVLVLLAELGRLRARRIPLYAGIVLLIANAFLNVAAAIHATLALGSMVLFLLAFLGGRGRPKDAA